MKILVTGGAGFIGSHLVDKLIAKHTVAVLDDLSGGEKENVNPQCDLFVCDIRDTPRVNKIFARFRPEIVFHLAANAAENKAQFSPIDITSRNFDGAIKVLTSSIKSGVRRFVFTSSIAVYGALQTPFKENDKPEPEDLYGITKLAFEKSLKVMVKVHEFEYVITRPHNVYGPRQNMRDPYRNVVTIFMNALLKGEPYYIYGDGEQRRCFSYIDDVIEALYRCGFDNVAGMTFNIGSDRDYTVNELSRIIQEVSGIKIPPIHLENRQQEVKVAVSDHTLSKKYLDYQDKTRLEEGVRKTWEWARSQGYQEPMFTKVEIDSKNLPSNWRKRAPVV